MVDEGSLASTVQACDLLRIANALRMPPRPAAETTGSGEALMLSLEVGLGSAMTAATPETEIRIEVGTGLRYADPASGLTMEPWTRGLIARSDNGHGEWSASEAVRIEPSPSNDQVRPRASMARRCSSSRYSVVSETHCAARDRPDLQPDWQSTRPRRFEPIGPERHP